MIDLASLLPLFWLIGGILLILLEFVVPGAIVVFFGLGAILTAAAVYFRMVDAPGLQFVFWSVSSLVLILIFRRQVRLWFPSLERYKPADEATELLGTEVLVTQDVTPDSSEGRVRYQGTSWKARSTGGPIPAGSKAKIAGRKNIILYIDPPDTGK